MNVNLESTCHEHKGLLTQCRHVLAGLDRQETHEGNLHAGKRSQGIPAAVADIESCAKSTHADEDEGVHGEQAGDEGIATPRRHHVSVEEGAESSPEHGTQLKSLDPQVEGKDEKENGDGLVVVRASHGSRDVARGDTHEDRRQQTGRGRGGHFIGEKIRRKGREPRAGRGEHDADVPDVDRDGDGAEGVPDGAAGYHQARIEGASSNAAQRVPCPVVKPIPEFVEAIRHQVFRRSIVEPRVDCQGG